MEYDIKKLQSVEVGMLKKFVDFCYERNISYFLIGGSALGAARHKGFIPWDDDIDIGIPRRDYEKLLNIPENELPTNCILNCFHNEYEYPYYFAKLCDKNTVLLEHKTKHLDFRHCVYIDIFPLDGAPESKAMQWLHFFRIRFYKKLQNLHHGMTRRETTRFKSFVMKAIQISVSKKWIFNRLNQLSQKYNFDDSVLIANYFGTWGMKEITPKKYFGEGTYLFFENGNYKVPFDYDNYLKLMYGDYMKLPPEEKRKSHHSFAYVEL